MLVYQQVIPWWKPMTYPHGETKIRLAFGIDQPHLALPEQRHGRVAEEQTNQVWENGDWNKQNQAIRQENVDSKWINNLIEL